MARLMWLLRPLDVCSGWGLGHGDGTGRERTRCGPMAPNMPVAGTIEVPSTFAVLLRLHLLCCQRSARPV